MQIYKKKSKLGENKFKRLENSTYFNVKDWTHMKELGTENKKEIAEKIILEFKLNLNLRFCIFKGDDDGADGCTCQW